MTLTDFYKIAKQCGYSVFKKENFYEIFFNNDTKGECMAYFYYDVGCSNTEAKLFTPHSYFTLPPSTYLGDEVFTDQNEFRKQLLKNTFIMKKMVFHYYDKCQYGLI